MVTTRQPVPRGTIPLAAALVVGTLLAGCAGGPTARPAAAAAPSPTRSVTPVQARPATELLAAAAEAMRAVRGYSFDAVETVGTAASSRVRGRAVLPAAMTYTLTVDTHRQQVVRVGGSAYLRVLPAGRWQRLAGAATVDPLTSLLGVLAGLTGVHAAVGPGGSTRVTGALTGAAASRAGLLTVVGTGITLPVTLTLDAAHRVTSFAITVPLRVAGRTVTARETTTYAGFGVVTPITAPI